MPFKLHLRRGKKYKVSTKESFTVRVHLLNGHFIECNLTSESTGKDCIENVAQRVELGETEYFGLRYLNHNLQLKWIDLDKPVKKQLDKYANSQVLYFGVMYYIAQAHLLTNEMTRYQFFLQLKNDVIEGKLPCTQEQAVLLAGYDAQAEYGDYDPEKHENVKELFVLPRSFSTDERVLSDLRTEAEVTYRSLQGMLPATAEVLYISEAQQLDGYGLEYYPAKDETSNEVLIGASFIGIFVKQLNGQPTVYFKWKDIIKLVQQKKTFGIESSLCDKMVTFSLIDVELAKYVWRICSLQQNFYKNYEKELQKESVENSSIGGQSQEQESGLVNMVKADLPQDGGQSVPKVSEDKNGEVPGSAYQDSQRLSRQLNDLHVALEQAAESSYLRGNVGNQDQQPPVSHWQNDVSVQQSASFRHSRADLPKYRATPDYETVMQKRMERLNQQQQQQPHNNLDLQIHGVANIGNAQVYSQPEMMAYSQPEIRHTQQFSNKNKDPDFNFDKLDSNSICQNLLREAGLTQQSMQLKQYVPQRPVDRASSLIIHPTYSTPDLFQNNLPAAGNISTSEQMITEAVLHHFRPPPPYPRSSSSTPDLVAKTAAHARSNPDLVTPKKQVHRNVTPTKNYHRSWENLTRNVKELHVHQQSYILQQTAQAKAHLGNSSYVQLGSQATQHTQLQGQSISISREQGQGQMFANHEAMLTQPVQQPMLISQTIAPITNTVVSEYYPPGQIASHMAYTHTSPPASPNLGNLTGPGQVEMVPGLPTPAQGQLHAIQLSGQSSDGELVNTVNYLHSQQGSQERSPSVGHQAHRVVYHTSSSSHSSGNEAGVFVSSGSHVSPALPLIGMDAQHGQVYLVDTENTNGLNSQNVQLNSQNVQLVHYDALGTQSVAQAHGAPFNQQLIQQVHYDELNRSGLQEPHYENTPASRVLTYAQASPGQPQPLQPQPVLTHQSPMDYHIYEAPLSSASPDLQAVKQPYRSTSLPATAPEVLPVVKRRQQSDVRSKEQQKESRLSVGPLKIAAMNGLIPSGSGRKLVNSLHKEDRNPVDETIKQLESRMDDGQIFQEFEKIPRKSSDRQFSIGSKDCYKNKNRFKDVLPYDSNRVKITPAKDNQDGYINASLVEFKIGRETLSFIATQGPLENTLLDFWTMVWDHEIEIIAMLTALSEQGKEKCHRYWPEKPGAKNQMRFGHFQVVTKFNHDAGPYSSRNLILRNIPLNQERVVWHLQYTDWPECGCPDDFKGFLSYLDEIECVNRHVTQERSSDGDPPPIVVHCSAGVGRTGVVILAEVLKSCVQNNQTVDVPASLTKLRQQRMNFVQTVSQYNFVYSIISQYLKDCRLV